jgi:hypothetical protein
MAWVITQVRSMLPSRNFTYHADGLGGQPEGHGLELVRRLWLNASGHGPPSPKPRASAGCQGEGQGVCRSAGGTSPGTLQSLQEIAAERSAGTWRLVSQDREAARIPSQI